MKTITVARVFGVIALGTLVGSSLFLARTIRMVNRGARTEGVVVDYDVGQNTERTKAATKKSPARTKTVTTHTPIVTFEIERDGKKESFRFKDWTGAASPAYPVGERVPVLYDPANPSDAVIVTFLNLYFGAIVCGVFAVAFGGAALAVRRRAAPSR